MDEVHQKNVKESWKKVESSTVFRECVLHFYIHLFESRTELFDEVHQKNVKESWKKVELLTVFRECVLQYRKSCIETKTGKHSAMAQFWYMCIEFLHHFHRLERSIRTNKVDNFTRAMTPIIALFFLTNYVNYSRWLSKFQLDLLNIDNTHPGLQEILDQGAFSVRGTDHNSSRLALDLTLEHTINADAASRQTGVSSMTNNYNAQLRWMLTKAARASFIDKVNDLAAVSDKEDVTADLQLCRLRRNATDLQSMIDQIEETCNPFQDLNSESLFSIHTGKAASDAVKQCLLKIPENRKACHNEFVEECTAADASRLEKLITRFKLVTFQNERMCPKHESKSQERKWLNDITLEIQ